MPYFRIRVLKPPRSGEEEFTGPPAGWSPTCTEKGAMKPYAIWLLERFRAGESPSELATREGIPLDRIRIRLDAAMLLERMRNLETNAYAERCAA